MRVKEWKSDVVFLHEVTSGAADRSYGIHVGRLAGLPLSVIKRAQDVLSSLERENAAGAVTRLANDLPLFQEHRELSAPTEPSLLEHKLQQLSPDELSPRDALELIYALKELAGKA